jgi:hypothetical protein
MKLGAPRIGYCILTVFLLFKSATGQDDATCGCPKPPVTVTCEKNQMAACAKESSGQCVGRCINLSSSGISFGFAAEVLTNVNHFVSEEYPFVSVGRADVSVLDLQENPEFYSPLIRSAEEGKLSERGFPDRPIRVSVGLPAEGVSRLRQDLKELEKLKKSWKP